ncbi:apolipoprotein N-acyltransferase [Roseateles sp. DB2]|uniref:apolipoprotein N-acyltransferase n=1 Tax=Roseateles sp. DB2 TaxID=3453717 RepID=UPI003EEF5E3E
MRGPTRLARWMAGLVPGAVLLLALLAGALQTAAFAPTQAWWLQPLALALLAALVWEASPRRAAWSGFCFGLGWLACGLWWLYISLHEHGHLAAPFAVTAVLLLAAFLSLYYAGALWAFARWRRAGVCARVGLFAALWLLAELARAQWLTGFPWIASGYAHAAGPLAAWAPWLGVYGITALAAGLAAALAALALEGAWRPLAGTLVLVAVPALLPSAFTQSSGTIRLSLLQPNVPQDQKFDRERWDQNLDALLKQAESARGQLVLTPESVVPLPLAYLEPEVVQRIAAIGQVRPLLLGSFLGDAKSGFVNSLVAIGAPAQPDGNPYSYGKRHLLPFGEFIPPGFHWFVQALRIPLDDQATGTHQRSLVLDGQRIRPLICYEDLFGEDFAQSLVGPEAATVLANASNLAWFGPRMVQDQHLQFSQMRSLEFQRPLVRSTNTGATAAIDHQGRVIGRLPAEVPGVLEVQVEGRTGATPYARWLAALGLWPVWGLGLAAVLALRRRAPGA